MKGGCAGIQCNGIFGALVFSKSFLEFAYFGAGAGPPSAKTVDNFLNLRFFNGRCAKNNELVFRSDGFSTIYRQLSQRIPPIFFEALIIQK